MTTMTAARQRKLQRLAHLLAGAILLGYVYVPVGAAIESAVRMLVFPLLVVTGIAMWQAPRLRRLLKRARS